MPLEPLVRQLFIPLLLVVIANTAPWAAAHIFHKHWTTPLDLGKTMQDGTRLLGSHKTWRGLIAAVVACALAAQLFGLGLALGAAFGALAILGDASSSFLKRRLRRPPGAELPGIDQIPESLLPLLTMQRPLGLGLLEILMIAAAFAVLDIAATKLRHP
ncbi:MAG: CDP-archaeol synthase [Gammaproteobacteria bacterium]|nr:CDP-archaeol synthase [Gammaproteobacteria bacterium]